MFYSLFLCEGSEESGAEDWRSSLEGTQMLKCVLSTLDTSSYQQNLFVLLHFRLDVWDFWFQSFHTPNLDHIVSFQLCFFICRTPIAFFPWHLCLFLRQSSRFLGWRRHWVVIEDGRVSWYHRQWANLHMLAKPFQQKIGLFTMIWPDHVSVSVCSLVFPGLTRRLELENRAASL